MSKGCVAIDKKYIDLIDSAESVFDIAAVCYGILEEKIASPAMFIGQFVDETGDDFFGGYPVNPNSGILRSFADAVSRRLEKFSVVDFDDQKAYIVEQIQNIKLVSFQEYNQNQLSVIFTLLSVIDSLIPFWNLREISEGTALNIGESRESHLVYPTGGKNIHEELIREIGRERKSHESFDEILTNLVFLKRTQLSPGAEIPEICFLSRRCSEGSAHIKVAVISGFRGEHFEIHRKIGSTRVIRYHDEMQMEMARKAWEKMESAIALGVEFIILPEFCVSEKMLSYIKDQLAKWRAKSSQDNLIAVFPRSTWIESDDNVQIILDSWGEEQGRYYKNAPYREPNKKGSYQFVEGITHPGYRTCLFLVDGMGYILPATCRDVIDGQKTTYLVQKFWPAFLFVPAWSRSGRSFAQPLKEYAADYFTNSVLCNACGALNNKTGVVGGVAIPQKDQTVAAGYFSEFHKTGAEAQSCGDSCGQICGELVEIDLETSEKAPKERITWQSF